MHKALLHEVTAWLGLGLGLGLVQMFNTKGHIFRSASAELQAGVLLI